MQTPKKVQKAKVSSEKKTVPGCLGFFLGLYGWYYRLFWWLFRKPILRIPIFHNHEPWFMSSPRVQRPPYPKATCALALLELRRGQARFLGWRFGKDWHQKRAFFWPWKSEVVYFQLHLHLVRKKSVSRKDFFWKKSVVRPVVAMLNEFGQEDPAFWPFGNFIFLENLPTPMFTRAVVICGFTFSKKKFEVPTRENLFKIWRFTGSKLQDRILRKKTQMAWICLFFGDVLLDCTMGINPPFDSPPFGSQTIFCEASRCSDFASFVRKSQQNRDFSYGLSPGWWGTTSLGDFSPRESAPRGAPHDVWGFFQAAWSTQMEKKEKLIF